MQVLGGNVTFKGLRVLSNGDFRIIISLDSLDPVFTEAFSVTNHVKKCIASNPQVTSTNFDVSISALLIADDDLPWVGQKIFTITNASNIFSYNGLDSPSVNGTLNYVIWFGLSGTYSLVIVNQNETTKCIVPVNVLQNKISVASIVPQPVSNLHNFVVKIQITSNDGSQIESKRGTYQVNLLSPANSPWNAMSLSTLSGTVSFNLAVFFDGIFSLVCTGPDLVNATSPFFTTLSSLSIVSNLTQPKQYWAPIDFRLYNELGNVYAGIADLYIVCSNSQYLASQVHSNNGTGTFWVSFNSMGMATCSAYVNNTSVINSFALTIINNTYPDPKCLITQSNSRCAVCIKNAFLDPSSNCQCISNSQYNSTSNQCQCMQGFVQISDFCAQCANYFSPSEISAHYSSDYTSIIVTFARQVSQSLVLPNCSSIISLPVALSQISSTCQWAGYTGMKISFGQIINIGEFSLNLNPLLLSAVGNDCNLNLQALIVPVKYVYDVPVPVAGISAPESFSLKCSNVSLAISVVPLSISEDYSYVWTGSLGQNNPQIAAFISSQLGPSFVLDPSLLESGSLQIGVTVKSKTFGTSASSQVTVAISASPILSPQFDTGSLVNVYVTDTKAFSVKTNNPCGSNVSYTYSWTFVQSPLVPALNFTKLMSKNLRNDTLIVYPHVLSSGINYTFTVKVYSGDLTGSTSLQINASPSPIEINFNRTDGVIGLRENLVVLAKAFDPDNPDSPLNYLWTCSQGTSVCVNSQNLTLDFNSSNNILQISSNQLLDGALYTFKITVWNIHKIQNSQINIQVNSSAQGSVDYILSDSVLNSKYNNTIVAKVTLYESATFLWSITPLGNTSISIDLGNSYLLVPAGYLDAGTDYRIQLSLIFASGNVASGFVMVATASAPHCVSFTSTLSTGKWLLSGNLCQDTFGSVYYQFGSVNAQGKLSWLSSGSYSNAISLKLRPNTRLTVLNVCNSFAVCTQYTNNVTLAINSQRRNLNTLSDFESDVLDSELVPSSIIYYTGFISDQITFDTIFDTYYSYFSTVFVTQQSFDSLIDCSSSLVSNNSLALTSNTLNNITILITNTASQYNSTLTSSEVFSILQMFDPYLSIIDPVLIDNLINTLGTLWIGSSPLNSQVLYSGNLFFFRIRLSGSSIPGLSLQLSNNALQIPSDFPADPSTVYDLQFAVYNSSFINVDFALFSAGSYVSQSLSLISPITTEIVPSSPLAISASGTFDPSQNYQCLVYNDEKWVSELCSVESVSQNAVVLSLAHESLFSIQINNDECGVGKGPIAMMSVLIFLWVTLSVFFSVHDKNYIELKEISINVLHPLSSLFIKQNKPRRAVIASQFFASSLLLLALIGAIYDSFDSPTSITSESEFDSTQLSRGAAGWALLQVFNLPMFILNSFAINQPKLYRITFPSSVVIGTLSFIGIVVMTVKYCGGLSNYWLINFVVFLAIDSVLQRIICVVYVKKVLGNTITADVDPQVEIKQTSMMKDEENLDEKCYARQNSFNDSTFVDQPGFTDNNLETVQEKPTIS